MLSISENTKRLMKENTEIKRTVDNIIKVCIETNYKRKINKDIQNFLTENNFTIKQNIKNYICSGSIDIIVIDKKEYLIFGISNLRGKQYRAYVREIK